MKPSRKNGFTLVEIMVTTMIISLLLAVATPSILRAHIKAREAKLKGDLRTIRAALEQFNNDTGVFPVTPYQLTQSNPTPVGHRVTENGIAWNQPFDPASYKGPYLKTLPTVDPLFKGSPAGNVHGNEWVYDSGPSTMEQNWIQAPSQAMSTEGTSYNTW